jgi:hypothetical protein
MFICSLVIPICSLVIPSYVPLSYLVCVCVPGGLTLSGGLRRPRACAAGAPGPAQPLPMQMVVFELNANGRVRVECKWPSSVE